MEVPDLGGRWALRSGCHDRRGRASADARVIFQYGKATRPARAAAEWRVPPPERSPDSVHESATLALSGGGDNYFAGKIRTKVRAASTSLRRTASSPKASEVARTQPLIRRPRGPPRGPTTTGGPPQHSYAGRTWQRSNLYAPTIRLWTTYLVPGYFQCVSPPRRHRCSHASPWSPACSHSVTA
jgi:hypothetical protein